jgi:phosphatidate cytidylyltransferase
MAPSTPSDESGDKSTVTKFLFVVVSMIVSQLSDKVLQLGIVLGMTALYIVTRNAHLLHGLLMVTIPFHTWYQVSQSFTHTVTLLFIVWNCDTGALVAGRIRRMLFPNIPLVQLEWLRAISAAKSIAGIWGGILLGVLTTMGIPVIWTAVSEYLPTDQKEDSWWLDTPWDSWLYRLLLGSFLSLLAILGDLVESAVKREAGKKDTGKLLPGHGGILDRFDSSLLAVVAYSYLCIPNDESE